MVRSSEASEQTIVCTTNPSQIKRRISDRCRPKEWMRRGGSEECLCLCVVCSLQLSLRSCTAVFTECPAHLQPPPYGYVPAGISWQPSFVGNYPAIIKNSWHGHHPQKERRSQQHKHPTCNLSNLQSIALLCLVLICPTEHGALLKSGKELVMQQNSLTFDQWQYILKKTYHMYPAVFKLIRCVLPCFTNGCQNFAPRFLFAHSMGIISGLPDVLALGAARRDVNLSSKNVNALKMVLLGDALNAFEKN